MVTSILSKNFINKFDIFGIGSYFGAILHQKYLELINVDENHSCDQILLINTSTILLIYFILAERNGTISYHNKVSRISLKRQTPISVEDFGLENLNPYFDGENCSTNNNCYACTSDSACAWCSGNCISKIC